MARLRQIAFVARDLDPPARALRDLLDLDEPFRDPGVAEFGLHNVVFACGDTFIEIVCPTRDGTTAGRYLDRRGGDSGYMALFQVDDTVAARARAAVAGVRVVWSIDLPDISGTHLHPRDMGGAIVSFDTPDPRESWRWGGPAWTGGAPAHHAGGIRAVTVEVDDVEVAAPRWQAVLGLSADDPQVTFAPADGRTPGIVEVRVAVDAEPAEATICGVRIVRVPY